MVDRVLDGARSRSVETQLVRLADHQIGACRACMACKPNGVCAQRDGMVGLYGALSRARAFVLGTPIYFDHISGQTKVFLDRLYPYLGPNMEKRFPEGVMAVLVLTWEAADPHAYDEVGEWLEGRLAHYYGVKTLKVLTASDTEREPVDASEGRLAEAFEAGVGLAEAIARA